MSKKDAVLQKFYTITRSIISRIEKKSRSEVELAILDRLRKRISLISGMPGESILISTVAKYLSKYSDQIINRDEKFLETIDIRNELRSNGLELDTITVSLIDSIRQQYVAGTSAERDLMYSDLRALFDCGLEYVLL